MAFIELGVVEFDACILIVEEFPIWTSGVDRL